MKFVEVIFVIAVFVAYNSVEGKMTMEQIKNTLKPFKNSCIKKTSIDADIVERTKSGEFPSDPTLMCFYKCIFQMMKLLKNNEIVLDTMLAQIDIMMPEDVVDKIKTMSTNCHQIAKQKQETCEMVFEFVKCFYEADSALFFFP